MDELKHIEAAKKDPRQFRYLYDKYYKEIFLFVNRRTDDEHITADITQTVFLKALQNLKNYEYRGIPFSAWLYRIAGNEVMQHFRDNSKVRTVCLETGDVDEMLEENNSGIDPEKREQVFAAIKKLAPPDLEMIEMRFFEKRSFKEIADIKGITENNAKVKTYRILEKMKKHLTVEV
ncbi:MAG: sigma-70 family RNA polymerase sigma factor [Chitinophagales bacterium]|nr:sigma-70 family RNA polymerase sigma factor [Bacteroidota bacterium]MBX7142128.1 sigma-70 family RNA polymerase sigma factor [Chitinophagales bacterium]